MTNPTELIVLEPEQFPKMLSDEKVMQAAIDKIKKLVEKQIIPVVTKKDRDFMNSLAAKLARTKSPVTEKLKELNAEQQAAIDERKRLGKMHVTAMDEMRDKCKEGVIEWDENDAKRKAAHTDAIKQFDNLVIAKSSDAIKAQIETLAGKEFHKADWEEFAAEAELSRDQAVVRLNDALAVVLAAEDQARVAEETAAQLRELQELQLKMEEKAERDRLEREKRAEKERAEMEAKSAALIAEQKAKDDEIAAMKAKLAQAELDKQERIKQSAIDAENARQESARLEQEKIDAAAKVEKDKADALALADQEKAAAIALAEHDRIAAETVPYIPEEPAADDTGVESKKGELAAPPDAPVSDFMQAALAMEARGLSDETSIAVMAFIQGGEIPHVKFTGKP